MIINQITSGGSKFIEAEEKDVNFYDYDGTRLYSYTVDEFLDLTELPAGGKHAGLTSQGWNWTLSGAKTLVVETGYLDIGHIYTATDGKNRCYVHINEGICSIGFSFSPGSEAGTSYIDFGDGITDSISEKYEADFTHTYEKSGDYIITFWTDNQQLSFEDIPAEWSLIHSPNNVDIGDSIANMPYKAAVTKIIFGSATISFRDSIGVFKNMTNMKSIVLPELDSGEVGTGTFINTDLNCLVLSTSIDALPANFADGANINKVIISENLTTINNSNSSYTLSGIKGRLCLGNVRECGQISGDITELIIPSSVTEINGNNWCDSKCLNTITIYGSPTIAGSIVESTNKSISCVEFKSTTPPIFESSTVLQGFASKCYFYFPFASAAEYILAENYPEQNENQIGFLYATYPEGTELPTSWGYYSLAWFATKEDAKAFNLNNTISVGNGNEIYCAPW